MDKLRTAIPYVDLSAPWSECESGLLPIVLDMLRGGVYVNGYPVEEFEARVAKYLGVEHCVALNSGTDALVCGLVAVGVRPGTEVSLQAWRLGGFGYVASSSWTAETWEAVEYILGCTDPEAPEYDPEATVDDGSCTVTGIEFGAYRWLLGPRGSNCLGVCETIGRGCADLVADDFSETADDNICSRFFPDLDLDADGDGPRLSNTDADGLPTDSSSCVYRDHNWGGWSCEWVERDADVRMCPCE